MPCPGTSKHQKYFLQLEEWGKNPSSLHLNAGALLGVVGDQQAQSFLILLFFLVVGYLALEKCF